MHRIYLSCIFAVLVAFCVWCGMFGSSIFQFAKGMLCDLFWMTKGTIKIVLYLLLATFLILSLSGGTFFVMKASLG